MDKDKILETMKQIPLPLVEKAYSIDIWENEIRIQMKYHLTIVQTYVVNRIVGCVDGSGFFSFKLGINSMTITVIMT